MRRNITLYIGGHPIDLDDDNLVLFNYTQEELENPTIVKNSYSQQITLKGTRNNNKVFTDSFRLDKTTSFGYNPRLKVDFAIYNEMNEILESGYVKLDSVTRNKRTPEYKVTLYGGLGSFLYQLSFDEQGNKKTLADLDFLGTENPETEFNYTIGRTFVRQSWDVLSGEGQQPLGQILNFAPCYNGIPENFDADKAIYDFTDSQYSGVGILKASLSRAYTEMETQDFRSYLQRPILKVKAIFDGITRFATSIGWTFSISQDLYQQSDFFTKTWMTLPLLDVKNATSNMRSGEQFTKRILLGATESPASYLISFVKMFGLKILCDDKTKTISVMNRDDFFIDETIDLTSRIDYSKAVNITPLLINKKWYEMDSEVKGELADEYQKTYGRVYGSQRINTGYSFNADTQKITDSIIFKGAVQAQETSPMFLYVRDLADNVIPSPFIEGGTYETYNPVSGEATTHDLKPTNFNYLFTWWNQSRKGYDINDFVQLHEKDNKSMDGANVLLYYDKMVDAPSFAQLTDDVPDKMGESPCWNFTSQNATLIYEIPHFTRFQVIDDTIVDSLDFGESQELYVPGLTYDDEGCGIYFKRWRRYLTDRYDENTKQVSLRVNLDGLPIGPELLRKFYWFENSIWVLNKIKNYSLNTYDSVECEFIQVQDKTRYINGQE